MKLSKNIGALASAAIIAASMSACSTADKLKDGAGAATSALDADNARLAEKSSKLDSKEAALQARAAELDARESRLASAASGASATRASASAGGNYGAGDLLPPGAKPGQCFTRIWVPPQYQTVSERILVEEAGERIEIIPAKYNTVKKRVLVKEATEKLVTVPATFKTVKERFLVKAATKKIVEVKPVYETVTQRLLDKPAHTTWRKGTGPIQKIDETTGEIMCLVEIPATFKTVKKRVLKSPGTSRVQEIPAVYDTVEKSVIATKPTTRTVAVPAVYKTISVTEEASPPKERKIKIPAKYATVTKRKLTKDGKLDWREILCDTNMTRDRITAIQQALKSEGHDPGPIDGVIGGETMVAVNAFQRKKGLPVDRYLNIATVRALGVSPK